MYPGQTLVTGDLDATAALGLAALLSFEQGLAEAGGGLLAAKTAGALAYPLLGVGSVVAPDRQASPKAAIRWP